MAQAVAAGASPAAALAQLRPVQDTAGVTQALAAANIQPIGSGDHSPSPFHSLFSTDDRRGAVAGVVSELWGTQAAAAAASNTSGSDTLLNLFRIRDRTCAHCSTEAPKQYRGRQLSNVLSALGRA